MTFPKKLIHVDKLKNAVNSIKKDLTFLFRCEKVASEKKWRTVNASGLLEIRL
jgi:hypothetical protein